MTWRFYPGKVKLSVDVRRALTRCSVSSAGQSRRPAAGQLLCFPAVSLSSRCLLLFQGADRDVGAVPGPEAAAAGGGRSGNRPTSHRQTGIMIHPGLGSDGAGGVGAVSGLCCPQILELLVQRDREFQELMEVAQQQGKVHQEMQLLEKEVEKRDSDIQQLQKQLKEAEHILVGGAGGPGLRVLLVPVSDYCHNMTSFPGSSIHPAFIMATQY